MGFFSFLSPVVSNHVSVNSVFPLSLACPSFIKTDIVTTYKKILTDTCERTSGIPKKLQKHLYDSCLQSDNSFGLITYLANAMYSKSELYLVFKNDVLRVATADEKELIKKDYDTRSESSVGVYVSFRNFDASDMVKIYSTLEYCVLGSMHKSLNLSNAIQFKMNDMRQSTALNDASLIVEQATEIAKALGLGKDIIIDKNDEIATAMVDTAPSEKASTFLMSKKAFYLSMPLSYIDGIQTVGMGSTGEQDMKAVERGLRQYFVSIIEPVVGAIFNLKSLKFDTQDFRQITSALEILKSLDLVSDENLMPLKLKQRIIARAFEIDLKELEDAIDPEIEEQKQLSFQNNLNEIDENLEE